VPPRPLTPRRRLLLPCRPAFTNHFVGSFRFALGARRRAPRSRAFLRPAEPAASAGEPRRLSFGRPNRWKWLWISLYARAWMCRIL
jgi:hypothetical protein